MHVTWHKSPVDIFGFHLFCFSERFSFEFFFCVEVFFFKVVLCVEKHKGHPLLKGANLKEPGLQRLAEES